MANREQWGSKLGFILAAAGSAVGLGNIWKFPYITGENGGAAFVFIYMICILLLGLPIVIAELVIGRHTQKDPVGAFKSMLGGTGWVLVGYMGVLSGFFILSFYSVVGGWTLGYMVKCINGFVTTIKDTGMAAAEFSKFSGDPSKMLLYHFLFMLVCIAIVIRGIKKGIERFSKLLMPVLFLLLIIIIIRGLSMEGSLAGVSFLMKPDFSKLTISSVITALGHSFFTLSLGMGALITYGSYLSKNESILNSAVWIVALDTCIAILAGFAIFPAVFATGMDPSGGPGLIFQVLPVVFSNMAYGSVFAFIFFLLIFIAALTSAISLLEVTTAYIVDEKGWTRPRAVLTFGMIIFLLGIPSAMSFGPMSGVTIFLGNTFFDFMDKLTSNYMLPIGGFFIAVSLGWKYGLQNAIHELDTDTKSISIRKIWAFFIKFISPILVMIIFGYKLYETLAAMIK